MELITYLIGHGERLFPQMDKILAPSGLTSRCTGADHNISRAFLSPFRPPRDLDVSHFMTIPRKIRRNIVVGDDKYYWCTSGTDEGILVAVEKPNNMGAVATKVPYYTKGIPDGAVKITAKYVSELIRRHWKNDVRVSVSAGEAEDLLRLVYL
jgi:hypothetical protein